MMTLEIPLQECLAGAISALGHALEAERSFMRRQSCLRAGQELSRAGLPDHAARALALIESGGFNWDDRVRALRDELCDIERRIAEFGPDCPFSEREILAGLTVPAWRETAC